MKEERVLRNRTHYAPLLLGRINVLQADNRLQGSEELPGLRKAVT